MGRPRKNKTVEETIKAGIEKDYQEQPQVVEINAFFEAPKEKTQSNREMFSEFWGQYRFKNKKIGNLEDIVWAHLVAIKHDKPSLFEAGIKNFGL